MGPAMREFTLNSKNVMGFNGAETNCRIAHILGILLMNSYNTDIFFSNYYHLQSVRFEYSSGYTVNTVTPSPFQGAPRRSYQ